ncbi:MAG: aldehyde dehydrogenase family protein [Subtercola sp.]|nr:aldehyde dehydrogenase family protein [Subtercola sp.]
MTLTETRIRAQHLYIGGEWMPGARVKRVHDRFTAEPIADVALADEQQSRSAVDAAAAAMRIPLSPAKRSEILSAAGRGLTARAEEFAQAITAETGKPITAARTEVQRGIGTIVWAAEETRRLAGEVVALDAIESGEGTFAQTILEPRGIVAAITPFNFPLNLLLHKVAPAVAAGCAVVLKPSEKSMIAAGMIVEVFEEAGLPAGRLNLVTGTPKDVVDPWIVDDRVAVITFTGSTSVGWSIKARSPRKLHILELGSNTAMVVLDDADITRAADDAITASLSNSGQACISLQRLYVTPGAADTLTSALRERFARVLVGNPHLDGTMVGPMITTAATDALKKSIDDAIAGGATALNGGAVVDGILLPTLLTDIRANDSLITEEAFGPVLSVVPVPDLQAAIAEVNSSQYALNTAIYTTNLASALQFGREAEAGSVLVNMPPSFRTDHMPYGGVKGSGQGTEGVKYAIEELLHHKLFVLKA